MKKVYICAPCKTNEYATQHQNIMKCKKYAKFVMRKGFMPLAPQLIYPQFMKDTLPHERDLARKFGLEMLRMCDELWIFGNHVSGGMQAEIDTARAYGILIVSADYKE